MEDTKEIKSIALLNEILSLYRNNGAKRDKPTFFEIIGRTYDEDLISKMLAYILENDKLFVSRLLNFYFNNKKGKTVEVENLIILSVKCEKKMSSGRADIFVEATDGGKKYVITIENKIRAGIHGTAENEEQTDTYFNYVNKVYAGCEKAFLFLKPEYNAAKPKCSAFECITYKQLLNLISNDNANTHTEKVKDFKRHIERFLSMNIKEFSQVDKKIIENLSLYTEIMQSVMQNIDNFKTLLFKGVSEKLNLDYNVYNKSYAKTYEDTKAKYGLTNDNTDDVKCCKFYRADLWYRNCEAENKYWFYVEIKFNENNPANIVVQKVIKRYGYKGDLSIVKKFVDGNLCGLATLEGQFYVFDTQSVNENIKCVDKEFSADWQREAVKVAYELLKKQIEEMDEIFRFFQNFVNGLNTVK